jgi:hypothetical protein
MASDVLHAQAAGERREIDTGIIAGELGEWLAWEPSGDLGLVIGDHGSPACDRLGVIGRVEQPPEIALEIQASLLRDLVVDLGDAKLVEQERERAIVGAIRIALDQREWQ